MKKLRIPKPPCLPSIILLLTLAAAYLVLGNPRYNVSENGFMAFIGIICVILVGYIVGGLR
jgi:lipopolysaccharide export LptBFGC system permease protein LptF